MKYVVIDTTNHVVRYFKTFKEADYFRIVNSRFDWIIVSYTNTDYKSTPKQQAAVKFVLHVLDVEFQGNIYSGRDCSEFLSEYLEIAKQHINELECDYETNGH